MDKLCSGRVVIVTGAGHGVGRAVARVFGQHGAQVVVNDLGINSNGMPIIEGIHAADQTVADIVRMGGEACANHEDVVDWYGAKRLVQTCLDTYGRLDVLVNNTDLPRSRMLVSMTEADWDATMRVHLKGHFCTSHHAAQHWRRRSKSGGELRARIINTTSPAGLQGWVGQSAYSVAKAGIAALTLVQAAELGRYGVTANAIAPVVLPRTASDGVAEALERDNVSPLVVWLASCESREVTGRVFEISGGSISLSDGWRPSAAIDIGGQRDPASIGAAIADMLGRAPKPLKVYGS